MTINNNTILFNIEDIFKPFENNKGEIEISQNIDPRLIMFVVMILGITKTFFYLF